MVAKAATKPGAILALCAALSGCAGTLTAEQREIAEAAFRGFANGIAGDCYRHCHEHRPKYYPK